MFVMSVSTFDKQDASVVKLSFSKLRIMGKIKTYPPPKDLERLIHTFITSQPDYCNSLYMGLEQ